VLLALLFASAWLPGARAGDGDPPKDAPPPAKPPEGKGTDAKAPAGEAAKKEPQKDPAAKDDGPKSAATKDDAMGAKPVAVTANVLPARSPRSKREALHFLDQVAVSVNFDDTSLAAALSYLSVVTGVNIVVGPALRKEGDPDLIRVSLRLTKVSARQVLELLAEGKDLGIGFQSGVLTVTTRKEARGKPVLRLYALGDMLMPIRDFPAPDLMLHPAGAEKKVEPETETKPAFGEADEVLRMVKENTGAGTWDDGDVSASVMHDWLVVRQYEEVHAEIGKLLTLLRSAR
jgi:hypothetical protein